MKKILEIPHLMQYYDIENDFWKGRSCGIVSLAMVLDFYGIEVDLSELIDLGLKNNGYIKDVGWKHQVIVDLAKKFGLESRRREGEKIKNLVEALDKNEPVIISINKHFDTKNGGHLAVLNGYFIDKDGELMGFYVNDPVGASYKHKDQFIELEKFIQGWKKRAIYIKN